jgi:ATP-dependent helicase/nuclease subunit A
VQGVIDLLYETAAGELVLVDYKTDRDTDPRHARDRHGEQIRLYREAVTAVTGRPVAAAYLFMLSSGTIVAL